MNELEFKRHLKALAEGHHHPDEHDWGADSRAARKRGGTPAKRRTAPKTSRKK